MSPKKFAEIISYIFGIRVLPFVILAVTFLKSGLQVEQLLFITPVVLILQILIPISYIYYVVKYKKAASWELSNRKERYGFINITLCSNILSLIFIYYFGNLLLFHLNILAFISLVIFGAITRFWKISFHSSLITVTTIIINFLFNWQFPFLYLLIPIVYWARYTQKQHTLAQLFAGSLVSAGITLIGLYLFGYF